MGAFSVFTGAVYLLVSPPFSRTDHATPKTTQAETASGVCPTSVRISGGSSLYEDDKTTIFHGNFVKIHFPVSKIFFSFIFTSNCHDDIMITLLQQASS
jgi:hypothetical protein